MLMQIVIQSVWIFKSFGVEREDTVTIHIINVHPNNIRRNTMATQLVGYLHHLAIWIVSMATLMIAK